MTTTTTTTTTDRATGDGMAPTVEQVRQRVLVRDHLLHHPERHDQNVWFCGTTACVAGRACLLNGWVPVDVAPVALVEKDGAVRGVAGLAQEILGLSDKQAEYLFDGGRTTAGVHEALAALIAGS